MEMVEFWREDLGELNDDFVIVRHLFTDDSLLLAATMHCEWRF